MDASPPSAHARRFGPYLLGRRIGSGGMASVFAGRGIGALRTPQIVAVKVMATALAGDPAAHRMFEREALIATGLEHPNIVRTYEVGEVEGQIFLAMELVVGAPLSTLCARGKAPIAIATRIAIDLARGLHAAHELHGPDGEPLGLVHQDVTPHNVMVDFEGGTKILDFGIARLITRDGSRTDRVRGKPAYLAPEQRLHDRVDRRTDIYGAGAVLFELLTGERLHRRDSDGDIREAAARGRDVRALRDDVPEPLARVVAKALATDPNGRYPTAEALRVDLRDARDECSMHTVSDAEVGAWVRALAPPAFSLAELEREAAAPLAAPPRAAASYE